MRKHVAIGLASAVALFLVYLGVVTAAQGPEHALKQAADLWYWMALLAAGFGTQVGLFSFIRRSLRERRAANTAGLAASGGMSAGSMAACCAHHLSDVLPLLGLSTIAGFVASYQVFFMVVGLLSNAVGITIMLETIQRHGLSPLVARFPLSMGWVKRGAVVSSVLVALITLIITNRTQA